jgi:hypothetical protein
METRNQVHNGVTFQGNEIKKKTVLRIRMGRDEGKSRWLVALA